MVVINMQTPKEPPALTPRDMTEQLLQAIYDGTEALNIHLAAHPDSINHVRWVANEGDAGCTGAAVVVALMEKNLSKVKARIMGRKFP